MGSGWGERPTGLVRKHYPPYSPIRLTVDRGGTIMATPPRGKDKRMRYEKPVIVDYGSIGDHTFDNPGVGDKGTCGNDPMWNEPSCPS